MENTGFFEYQCFYCGKFYSYETWLKWSHTGAVKNGGGRWCSYNCFMLAHRKPKDLSWRPGKEEDEGRDYRETNSSQSTLLET